MGTVPGLLGGRYRPIEVIGQGTAGTVYLCADSLVLDQRVAVKMLRSEACFSTDMRSRFARELQILNRIRHPNIIWMIDSFCDGASVGYAMEHCAGSSLERIIRERIPLSRAQVFEIGRQVLSGLEVLHREGILHRDLKPSNILVSEDNTVRIADFGVAKLLPQADLTELSQQGAGQNVRALTGLTGILGTIRYLPPEVLFGKEFLQSGDVYAFGVVMYELATGDDPWGELSIAELLDQKGSVTVARPKLIDVLGVKVADLVVRCLDPNPTRRPANIRDLATAFIANEGAESPQPRLEKPKSPRSIAGVVQSVGYAAVARIRSYFSLGRFGKATSAIHRPAALASRNDRVKEPLFTQEVWDYLVLLFTFICVLTLVESVRSGGRPWSRFSPQRVAPPAVPTGPVKSFSPSGSTSPVLRVPSDPTKVVREKGGESGDD
jgi:serine/threonine-protein kinase